MDFSTGHMIGSAVERIRQSEDRLTAIEDDLQRVRRELRGIRSILERGGLLAGLWLTGALGHLKAETLGELLGGFLGKFLRIS